MTRNNNFVIKTKCTKGTRILLGIIIMVLVFPIIVLFTMAITQIKDNSYYGMSIGRLLDEKTEAVKSQF